MSSANFRRGQSRVYYASEIWDPGLATDEEFARTSFRSSCSEVDDFGNNEDYVASLIRRNNSLSEDEFDDNFLPPTYAKPLPVLAHPGRHSVLNRYDILY